MENKTSYSLQEAKNEVAKNNALKHFLDADVWHIANILLDQVAELYKEKATEELRKENEACQTAFALLYRHSKEMGAEIDRLTQSNKELEQWKKEQMTVWGPVYELMQFELSVGQSISENVLKILKNHYNRP